MKLNGGLMILDVCKNPFKVNPLDVFAVNMERQKEIGWGVVNTTGPTAAYKPGDLVFFYQGQETRMAMEDGIIRLVVDSGHVFATDPDAKPEIVKHIAERPNAAVGGVETGIGGIEVPNLPGGLKFQG
jgi:hypothetical protein